MGYYQDNFPGSPAARQRILVSRGLVLYSLLAGFAIYAFTPAFKDIKEVDKIEIEERRKLQGPWLNSRITVEEFMEARRDVHKDQMLDPGAAPLSEGLIREIYKK